MKQANIVGLLIISIGTLFTTPVKAANKNIQKLNNALIFDLFMNFEITEKNGNLSTIIDYLPNTNNTDFKKIEINSNMGGEEEVSQFEYNDKGFILKLIYQVNDKLYRYEFFYDGNRLATVNIAGKKKISLAYDKKGRLQSITRFGNGAALEYNFVYLNGENKANIALVVIQGEKRSPSKRKYFVTWNDQFKIDSYCIDVYCSNNLTYSQKGDLTAFKFSNVSSDNIEANWEYRYDNQGNWIERKVKDSVCKRTIEYR